MGDHMINNVDHMTNMMDYMTNIVDHMTNNVNHMTNTIWYSLYLVSWYNDIFLPWPLNNTPACKAVATLYQVYNSVVHTSSSNLS